MREFSVRYSFCRFVLLNLYLVWVFTNLFVFSVIRVCNCKTQFCFFFFQPASSTRVRKILSRCPVDLCPTVTRYVRRRLHEILKLISLHNYQLPANCKAVGVCSRASVKHVAIKSDLNATFSPRKQTCLLFTARGCNNSLCGFVN